MRLGEILAKDYRVPESTVRRALHFQRTSGTSLRLGEILLKMKALPRRELLAALGQQLRLAVVVGLPRMPLPPSLGTLVPRSFARTRRVVPLGVTGAEGDRRLLLAMADPTDAVTVDVVERATGCEVVPVVALEEEILEAIALLFPEARSRRADALHTPPSGQPIPSPRRARSPAATRPSTRSVVGDDDATAECEPPTRLSPPREVEEEPPTPTRATALPAPTRTKVSPPARVRPLPPFEPVWRPPRRVRPTPTA